MTLRLIHTADWQLGKPFQRLPADIAALLREARLAAVRTIASLATRHDAAAVLVAGDMFDSNLVPERTIVQALAAMRGFTGSWILLPGNHDALLSEGVWSRLDRLGRPANLVIAGTPTPIVLADGRLVVLPAPLTERHTADDLTAWMDETPTPSGALRVGLAHGSVGGPPARGRRRAEPDRSRACRRAPASTISPSATGTAHSRSRLVPGIPARPNPTVSAPTRPATHFWSSSPSPALRRWSHACPRPAMPGGSSISIFPASLIRWPRSMACSPAAAGLEHALVQLTLTGAVDLATRAALEAHLERWSGELCHLEVRDQLLAEPSESDLLDLAGSPVVGTVARELAELAAADPAQREAAETGAAASLS